MRRELGEAGIEPDLTLHVVSPAETETWNNKAGKANKKMHLEFARGMGFPITNKMTKDQRLNLALRVSSSR